MNHVDSLARFRADPSKVRVSVRPCGNEFTATVASRIDHETKFWCTDLNASIAIDAALAAAHRCDMEGIDLGTQWAYEHPFGRLGLEARR